jgi:hypothetical protein
MYTTKKIGPYGSYGGVNKRNHYVPPGSPDFTPNPPFTFSILNETDRRLMEGLQQTMKFYLDNAPNILVRTNVSSEPGNVDTFVMSTSAKPEDQIVYKSNNDVVVINDLSTIVNDPILDGGYF